MAQRRGWRLSIPVPGPGLAFTLFSVAWLSMAAWVLYIAFTHEGVRLPAAMALYLASTVIASVVAFVLFASDKWRAWRERPRIAERTLYLASLAGGWPGAHLARVLFAHKTQKLQFRAIFWLIVLLHLGILAFSIILGWPWHGLLVWLGWT